MQSHTGVSYRAKSVLIVDDHDIVRFGLETLVHSCPDLRLAGSASRLATALEMVRSLQPDLVISDMGTQDSKGLDTVRALVAAQSPRPVLIVSVHDEMLYAEQVMALGARGYLMKERAHQFVIDAALTVLEGGTWLSPRLNTKLVQRLYKLPRNQDQAEALSLSAREFEVLQLLKSGKSTKEIAAAMHLSVRTVDIHRSRIKHKLGLRTGAELIAFASSRL